MTLAAGALAGRFTVDGGVIAGGLIGLFWVIVGTVVYVVLQRREHQGRAIGIFLGAAGVLTLLATVLLAVVPR